MTNTLAYCGKYISYGIEAYFYSPAGHIRKAFKGGGGDFEVAKFLSNIITQIKRYLLVVASKDWCSLALKR